MSATFNIVNLRSNTQTGVVTHVIWNASETSGNNTVNVPGITQVSVTEGQTIVPYANLTPQIVSTWITSAIGTEGLSRVQQQLDAKMQSLIASQTTPPVTIGTPWSTNNTTASANTK